MNEKMIKDLSLMKEKLRDYVEKGRAISFGDVREEPVIAVKPEKSRIRPLEKMSSCDVHFIAVDCSTRTLRRANNWGIYLLRVSSAGVKGRNVDWSFEERMFTLLGEAYVRRRLLQDARLELESEMALRLVADADDYTYLLLDGASYFGGERKFRASLYEKCEKNAIKLLTISKQSPTLRDEKGRDFAAAAYALAEGSTWVYHPVVRADIHEHLYGDVSLVKLSGESPRVFRCDIMNYLVNQSVDDLLSPLTTIAEDPRCIGYPIVLWLAHDFSAPSESQLLNYYDLAETKLKDAGVLDTLRSEELSCNFTDELHGNRYAFNREWIDYT
ncbi:MAG TPA: DNA double-strand break repair nuclease NurA [Candidatus Krumholzibacteriaceae bacterium]|jgi:hypothetical protein|nr:DNA double-strand break repair nuclease NurA [Candidatus Krumholzibacteriaceae bacterium]